MEKRNLLEFWQWLAQDTKKFWMPEIVKSGLLLGLLCHLERGCEDIVHHRVTWACGDLWQELHRQRRLELR